MSIFPSMDRPVAKTVDYTEESQRFFSIQMTRYLEARPSGEFSGPAERDAVWAIIRDAWVELRASGSLNHLSPGGREAVYCTTIIVFPTFVADAGLRCIPVDFVSRQRVGDRIIAVPKSPNSIS